MSIAEAYVEEIQSIDAPTISSKEWASPLTSEFEVPPARVLKFSRPEERKLSRSTEYLINIGGSYPCWFPDVARRLLFLLLNLKENWDSYGAREVTKQSVETALTLASVLSDDTPPPAIVPTPAGGIQMEWHASGIDLEVEVADDGNFSISFDDELEGLVKAEETVFCGANEQLALIEYVTKLTEKIRAEKSRI